MTIFCAPSHSKSKAKTQPATRTEKELRKLITKSKINIPFLFPATKQKEIPLNLLSRELLNSTELDLLSKYPQVIVHQYIPHCYFAIDSVGQIGIFSLTGQEIVPPIEGYIRFGGPNHILVGDITNDWYEKIYNVDILVSGLGIGHFQAIIDRHTLKAIIPLGKYQDIQYTIKGATSWYYVARLDDTGTLRWGVCDSEGTEVIPCEYLNVHKEGRKIGFKHSGMSFGGKFVGSNDLTMSRQERLTENKIELARARKEKWARVLGTVGNTLVTTATAMEQMGIGTGPESTSETDSTNGIGSATYRYREQYTRWERRAEQNYRSLTNLGRTTVIEKKGMGIMEKGGDTGGVGHLSSGNYVQQKKALREAQNQMAAIRRKASKVGIDIPQSKWETVTVTY